MKPTIHIVSLSGGKDSTAMLLRMIEEKMPVDYILFCDTGLEFPQMYEHLEKLEKHIGRKITRIKAEHSFEYLLLEHPFIGKDGTSKTGFSWAGPRMRWCTSRLKDKPREDFLRPLRKEYEVVQYVGIAADESYRLERKNNQRENCVHPLVDWRMTEADCLEYCYSRGFDWGGLYRIFKRMSCWCCPLQSLDELRALRTNFPVLWEQLKIWDNSTWRKFRRDYSVDELETRFCLEERRQSVGLPTGGKNKDFQAALKRELLKTRKVKDDMEELIVDNFAGGGGASTGIELATGRPVDIAINHDPDAIAMHQINHPHARHYCESVWAVNPKEICEGKPVGLMWLSPDCKHFSRAKGGKPVSKNVRGLAWIALRWAATVKPRVIMLENVPEFVTWGRLGRDGKPNPKHTGETFWSFVRALERHGYEVAWRELSACDYGAPTIRTRFFLVARCDGKPIVFPKATHGEGLLPYRTAAECIDWSLPCSSIFGREKPLAENTLRRIARGLDKFTIKSDKPFIMKYFGGIIGSDISKPLGTVTAIDHNALVAPSLIQYHSEQSGSEVRGQPVSNPLMTVDASPRYALTAAHIVKYYKGDNYSSVNDPLHTVTVKERHMLIESHLCILRRNQTCKSLNEPFLTECTSAGHFAEIRTVIKTYGRGEDLGQWAEIRKLLNTYCGYALADNEILLLEINGEQFYISDIGLRMLTPRELYRAQGFPEDYIIDFDVNGKKYPRSAQIARCGNAVPPLFAKALVEANLPEMCESAAVNVEERRRA
ncbi:MAG: DNA cytosine methyltransferase [Eubacterium sp.]|nr:DNA cytosine methyltransferase [Eubacterium sp.]